MTQSTEKIIYPPPGSYFVDARVLLACVASDYRVHAQTSNRCKFRTLLNIYLRTNSLS